MFSISNRSYRIILCLAGLALSTSCSNRRTYTPPPLPPKIIGMHLTLSCTSAGDTVTFNPPANSPYPDNVTINANVRQWDDWSDGRSTLGPPIAGAVITVGSSDPKSVSVSSPTMTTDAGGDAHVTANASSAVTKDAIVDVTVTHGKDRYSPTVLTITNKAQ